MVNDCRTTVGKSEIGHEPSKEFKKSILFAEHSPIRDIHIKWRWDSIKSWIATHFSRHMWECFIQSQRSDRTGVPRDDLRQDELVSFVGDANIQNLIDTMRKRLCFQASKETRQYAEDLKIAIYEVEPEIADVLVPNCVYRGFCPEMNECGFWHRLSEKMTREEILDGEKRYAIYNKYLKNRLEMERDSKS